MYESECESIDEVAEAKEWLDELRARACAETEAEFAELEAAAIEAEAEQEVEELLDRRDYVSELELTKGGMINAKHAAAQLGFRPWRKGVNGHQWYRRIDAGPIRGVPASHSAVAALDDDDDSSDDEQTEAADDLGQVLQRIADLENRVLELEEAVTKPETQTDE